MRERVAGCEREKETANDVPETVWGVTGVTGVTGNCGPRPSTEANKVPETR